MKIGIDARPLIGEKPSGIGNYLVNILKACENTSDVEYILYSNEELLHHVEVISKFRKRIVPGSIGTLWVCYGLKKELEKDGIDVFWGTQHMLPLNTKGIKLALTVHDLALLINPKWGSTKNAIMQNVFGRLSVRKANRIFADSQSTANDIKKIVKEVTSEIYPIFLGGGQVFNNDENEIENEIIRSKFNIEPFNYFIYVGTIEPRKNISGLIKAYNIYRNKYNVNKKIYIVGGLGWKYKPIIEEICKSPYNEDIIMPGYVTEYEKSYLLKNAEAFVFPSNYEGFGFPVLEAMSYGVPVIITNVSSLPEVGGEYAFYVDSPDDWDGIAELMHTIDLMSTVAKCDLALSEKKWYEKFDWNICAETTRSLLEF